MRILCLDVGSKTVGVALSDPLGYIAQALTTLRRQKPDQDYLKLKEMILENEVKEIVVGLPLNMNGTEGTQAREVRSFVEGLRSVVADLPIVFWDERLSSVAAERSLLEGDVSRGKRKKVIDQIAAVFILQGYLESKRGLSADYLEHEEN